MVQNSFFWVEHKYRNRNTISVSGMTSNTLSCFRVSRMNLSFSGHISGHVPTNTFDMSRSVLFGRPVLTQRASCVCLFMPCWEVEQPTVGGGLTLTQDLVSLFQQAVFFLSRLSHLSNEVGDGWRDRTLQALALSYILFLGFSLEL